MKLDKQLIEEIQNELSCYNFDEDDYMLTIKTMDEYYPDWRMLGEEKDIVFSIAFYQSFSNQKLNSETISKTLSLIEAFNYHHGEHYFNFDNFCSVIQEHIITLTKCENYEDCGRLKLDIFLEGYQKFEPLEKLSYFLDFEGMGKDKFFCCDVYKSSLGHFLFIYD